MKKAVIVTLILTAIAGMIGLLCCHGQSADAGLLAIDGKPVKEDEYRWAMYAARNEVLTELTQQGFSSVVWDEPTELGMPYEMVMQKTISKLKQFHAVAELAEKNGYSDDFSFNGLSEEMAQQNAARKKAIEEGQVVTGLADFTIDQYIAYRMEGVRREYCFDPKNPGMAVSDEELRTQYEKDKDTYYTLHDDMDLCFIEIDRALENAEELAAMLEDVRRLALELHSLEKAAKQFPAIQPYIKSYHIDGIEYSAYAKAYGTLMYYAEDLPAGELSEVIPEYDTVLLIECTARTENRYRDLEAVSGIVEQRIREQRYDDMVLEKSGAMKVKYDEESLLRFTAGALGCTIPAV